MRTAAAPAPTTPSAEPTTASPTPEPSASADAPASRPPSTAGDRGRSRPTSRPEGPSGKRTVIEDEFLVEGKLEKPSAYFILRRSSLDYDWARLDAKFSPLVLESVQDPLF